MITACQAWLADWGRWWNRFWFTPDDPALLGLMRVLVGSMVFYTHAVWTIDLEQFFGNAALLPRDYRNLLGDGNSSYGLPSLLWSHFDWLPADSWLLPVHLVGLAIIALFTVGLWTRWTGILTALLVISYVNRTTGAQYGLDQINSFLTLYLALGPSGEFLSVDSFLARRQGRGVGSRSVLANIAIRLIQVHMCIVYLFAGLGKLQGDTWWNGQAIWGAVGNYEYQTLDLTWLAAHMGWVNLITYGTLFWEVSYPFLIWPRLTRPIWLAMAIAVHAGIGLAMGMITFGLIMIFGNLAFLNSALIRRWLTRLLPPFSGSAKIVDHSAN
jgi:hypothetical protein